MPPILRSALAVFGVTALLALPATGQEFPQGSPNSPPRELYAPVGTVLTVQVRDHLSSNRNLPGDTFLGMLQQPLVIDGWVVARAGQTVMGQVIQASSAGRVKGTSELGIELTEMILVDGRQVPLRTQLLKSYGTETHADDAGAIAGGTTAGAIIGAVAGHGRGALIGAGIGAAAATVGVLATRGKATEIYPETTMTFRLDAPLLVSTDRSRQAFLAVSPGDYERAPGGPGNAAAHSSVYGRPRGYPRRSGLATSIIPSIVLVAPIVVDPRDHGVDPRDHGRRRRW